MLTVLWEQIHKLKREKKNLSFLSDVTNLWLSAPLVGINYVHFLWVYSFHLCWCLLCSSVNRFQLWEKDTEIKEIKEQLNDLVALLKQSEAQRKELVKEQRMREQAVTIALASSASVRFSAQHFMFTWLLILHTAPVHPVLTISWHEEIWYFSLELNSKVNM